MSDGTMNLALPRGNKSVWDEPGWSAALASYDQERWMIVAGGSALAIVAAQRGGIGGGLLALAGSVLAVRAAMGHHDLRTARGWLRSRLEERGYSLPEDRVDHASEESFPASDSPSWTGTGSDLEL